METQLSQPAEAHGRPVDSHTPSPTSERDGLTTWMVAYYVVCLFAVVAVWGVMLLPPILTYSLLRSPLPVCVQTLVAVCSHVALHMELIFVHINSSAYSRIWTLVLFSCHAHTL